MRSYDPYEATEFLSPEIFKYNRIFHGSLWGNLDLSLAMNITHTHFAEGKIIKFILS